MKIKKRQKSPIAIKNLALSALALVFTFSPLAAFAQSENLTPSIVGITAPTVLDIGQTGTWSVNASDPENGSLSYAVDWGENGDGLLRLMATPTFVQTAEFSHAYSKEGKYKVKFTVRDDQGKMNTSSVTVYVRESEDNDDNEDDLTIKDFKISKIKTNQAKIVWKTEGKSDTAVWYGITSPVNTSGAPNVERSKKVEEHKITLTNLNPDTTYYLVARSKNSAGDVSMSEEMSFKTKAMPNKPPSIMGITGPSELVTEQMGTWTIDASDPENRPLSYAVDWGDAMLMRLSNASEPAFVQTAEFSHTYSSPGTYNVIFTVKDDIGQTASQTTTVTVNAETDAIAPTTPTGLMATVASSTEIDLAWNTSTDNVGVTGYNVYRDNVLIGTTTTTTTTFSDTGLFPATTYIYEISAQDAAGNQSIKSSSVTATTEMATDITPPLISNISFDVATKTIDVAWTTDEMANSRVYYSTTTPINIATSGTPFIENASSVTDHSLLIENLATSTTYYLIVQSMDIAGNIATSSELMVTTESEGP